MLQGKLFFFFPASGSNLACDSPPLPQQIVLSLNPESRNTSDSVFQLRTHINGLHYTDVSMCVIEHLPWGNACTKCVPACNQLHFSEHPHSTTHFSISYISICNKPSQCLSYWHILKIQVSVNLQTYLKRVKLFIPASGTTDPAQGHSFGNHEGNYKEISRWGPCLRSPGNWLFISFFSFFILIFPKFLGPLKRSISPSPSPSLSLPRPLPILPLLLLAAITVKGSQVLGKWVHIHKSTEDKSHLLCLIRNRKRCQEAHSGLLNSLWSSLWASL